MLFSSRVGAINHRFSMIIETLDEAWKDGRAATGLEE